MKAAAIVASPLNQYAVVAATTVAATTVAAATVAAPQRRQTDAPP